VKSLRSVFANEAGVLLRRAGTRFSETFVFKRKQLLSRRGKEVAMEDLVKAEAYRELNSRIFDLLDSFSALSILSSLDLQKIDERMILRRALKALTENLDIGSSSIFTVQEGKLVNCIGFDWDDVVREECALSPTNHVSKLTTAVGEGIMGIAFQQKTLQHCRDSSADSRFMTVPGQDIGSLISVPINQVGGEVLGVLNVSHPVPHFFNEWHERFLVVYCHCLGQLLANSRLINHMESEIEKRTDQLKRALEESKGKEQGLRLFQTIIESLQESVSISRPNGTLLYANPAFEELFGYTPQKMQQINVTDCYSPESAATFEAEALPALAGGECWEGELLAVDVRGCSFPLWTFVDAIRDEAGKVVFIYSFTRDLRQRNEAEESRKRLEAQLHQAQKMEAVGQLAGGVAHDFNNVITAIIGYAHLLLAEERVLDPARYMIEQIIAASERAADVTRGLLAFSRKQVLHLRPVDVNNVLESMEGLLTRLIGEDIELKTKISPEKLVVMADNGQLEQVLMNLVTNSRDAMEYGGKITITAGREQPDEDFIDAGGYRGTKEYVCISVADTGTGMDAKVQEKMFEPFFTTKEVGKGTGLGLAIVYGLIKELNGHISVRSEVGCGTTFTIYLPLFMGIQEETKRMESVPLMSDHKTILIAEDDAHVRKTNGALLNKYGYRVLEAIDGEDAIEKFMKEKELIDLVILDVVMPRKNGKEVFDNIRRIRPDMKILFTSGYTSDIISGKGIIDEQFDFIEKPHFPEQLLNKVRNILSGKCVPACCRSQ
jgi:PAS domain S-box-containing protein